MSTFRPNKNEIFNAAAEITDVDERLSYIATACGNDSALRAEIEDLLKHDDAADSLLDRSAPGLGVTVGQPITEKPGTQIGPYKLLQQIGEGGMGVVYMAEQKQPVKRRVALKIIKPGLDTRQVIARFEAERQALAMMEHPNIARVLDGGATETGRPYFVMELVNGVSITKYCDEKHLSLRDRLKLFIPVCRAVQHAHQKGIIHRDLKPSNILVARYDGHPVPKVIDFGVARAANQTLTEKTLFTEFGQIVGTLEYMSPEQADRNQLDIDTRSDIYSLGVVLYELLAGETPFDKQRLRSAAWDEMLRIVREEEPPKPSTRLSSASTLPAIAANRSMEPAKLGALVRGELDWIVMKALDKDRVRRFETANQFAEDIEHYLNDQPVLACPPSSAYRLRKFARRNRGPMTIAAVATVSLIAVALGSVIMANNFRNLAAREGAAKQDAQRARDSAQAAQRREETEREHATANLYDSLIREVQSIRQARKTGYGDIAWQRLADARQLDTPKVDLAQLQAEAVSCLGDFAGNLPSEIKFDEAVTATAVGPAAAKLAVGLVGGDTIIYDVENDRVLQRLPGHQQPIMTVTFSSDQHTLVTGGSLGTVDIWQLANGAYQHIKAVNAGQNLKRHLESIVPQPLSCVLDADSRRLAIAYVGQKEVQLHGLQSDDDHKVFRVASGENVSYATLSPDGQSLVALVRGDTVDSVLVVWDVEREEVVARQSLQMGAANSVVFSRSGNSIACSFDQGIKILDANSLTETFSIRGNIIKRLAISHDGTRLAYRAVGSGGISLWNLLTGRLEVELEHSTAASLQFAPDAHVLVSSSGKSVRLWRPGVTPEMRLISGHQLGVPGVAFSPDNSQLASCSKDRSVKIWDAGTGALIKSLDNFSASVQGVAYSPDGKWLATCDWSGSIGIWDTAGWVCLGRLDSTRYGTGQYPWSIAFSPDGEYLSVSGNNIALWKTAEIRRLLEESARQDPIPVHLVLPNMQTRRVAFSPDSSLLASTKSTADGHRLRIWQTSTGQELWSPPARLGLGVANVFFYPDSRHVMFLATDGTAHTWDLVDRKLTNTTPVSSRVALSPDGRLCLDTSGIKRVDTNEVLVPSLPKGSGPGSMWFAAWSSDRQKLAISFSDGAITLWDLNQVHSRLSELGLAWDALPPVTQPYLKIQPRELTANGKTSIAEAFRQRGVGYLTKHDFARAEQDFVECQKLVPDSPYAKSDDFLLSLSQRNWEKMVAGSHPLDRDLIDDQLGKRLARCAASVSWELATDAQSEQPQLDAAAVLAEMAVEFAREDSANWNKLGVAQYRTSHSDAALESLLKADAMIEGGDRVHRMFLAMTLHRLGRTDEALQRYVEGAVWITANGKTGEQLRFREEAEKLLGLDQVGRVRLIQEYYIDHFPADANAREYYDRGKWFGQQGRHEEAIGSLTIAIEKDPNNAGFLHWRAMQYNLQGNHQTALEDANRALEIDPKKSGAHGERSWAHRQLGNLDQALADAEEAVKLSPKSAWAYRFRRDALTAKADYVAALADAEKAVELDGGNRWGWHQLGLVCSKLKRWTRAAEVYQRLLEFEPNGSGYWGRYTTALVASGQLSKYREFCAELLERHGLTDDPKIASEFTYPLLLGPDAVDDWSLPLKLSQLLLNSGSGEHWVKKHVSELLCRAGEYERSLELRAEAIAQAGREPHGWDCFWQAMAHHGLGNIDQAKGLASKARELADSDSLGANNHDVFEMMFTELTGKLNEPAERPSKEDETEEQP